MSLKKFHLGQYVSKDRGYITLESSSQRNVGSVQDLKLQDVKTDGSLEGLSSGVSGTNFHDVFIDLSQSPLQAGNSYYLTMDVPQDSSYDYTIEIQLVPSKENLTDYQFVKRITVPNGGSADSSLRHEVCLYNRDNTLAQDKVQVGFVHDYSAFANAKREQKIEWINSLNIKQDVIRVMEGGDINQKYSLYVVPEAVKNLASDADRLDYFTNINNWKTNQNNVSVCADVLSMTENWHGQSATGAFLFVEMCFTPIAAYTGIRLKIQRSAEDYNYKQISTDKITGAQSIQYGKTIDHTKLQYKLYSVSELIGVSSSSPITLQDNQRIRSITIQGHPGMMFLINGSDLRIGPTGFYSLEDVINIKSLKVIKYDDDIDGLKDHFIVNYQYAEIEGDEE